SRYSRTLRSVYRTRSTKDSLGTGLIGGGLLSRALALIVSTPPSDEVRSNSRASRPFPNGVLAGDLQPLPLESFASDFRPQRDQHSMVRRRGVLLPLGGATVAVFQF